MANLHPNFNVYHEKLVVSRAAKEKLISSRKALQEKIIKHFKDNVRVPPKFYIQGSYKMGTMILDSDGTYDVDLGVYLDYDPSVATSTLQKWVLDAVSTHTNGGAEHREKCVRVKYSGAFDIDLPVYVKRSIDAHPWLATKTEKYLQSDPKELCDWFKVKKTQHGAQLVRICRYLKSWANARAFKMPSGIALSVWAANYFVKDDRDDLALLRTLEAIRGANTWSVSCQCPATPKDDLTAKLDAGQKQKFKDALTSLIQDGQKATSANTPTHEAIALWKKHFGTRFN